MSYKSHETRFPIQLQQLKHQVQENEKKIIQEMNLETGEE